MKTIAITQRVDIHPGHGERRDGLDQRWWPFLARCGLKPLVLPNHPETALALLDDAVGLLLSGGNDLVAYGGDAPERDETEHRLLDAALASGLPTLGICRGMQVILDHFGAILEPIAGHVACSHAVHWTDGHARSVNSFHKRAALEPGPFLEATAWSVDGAVEAMQHPTLPCAGIMWHPERESPFHSEDIVMLVRFFGKNG